MGIEKVLGDNFISARRELKKLEFRMKNNLDLRFRFKDTARLVVLSTEAIFMYSSLLLNTTLLTSMFYNIGGVNNVPKVSTCIYYKYKLHTK